MAWSLISEFMLKQYFSLPENGESENMSILEFQSFTVILRNITWWKVSQISVFPVTYC